MKHIKFSLLFFAMSLFIVSCDDFELPDTGSIPDATPPTADFSYEQNDGEWKQVDFTNLSISATDYLWDFGDGNTTTESNPSFTYDTSGTYTVSLTASDKLSQANTVTIDVVVTEPTIAFTPEILNPSFEIEGDDDFRDDWRNNDLGQGSFNGLQITNSPVHEGLNAGKLPKEGDRIAYQLITVEPNQDYTISFYYTMKTSPVGTLTATMLNQHVTDPANIAGATITSIDLTDQSSSNTYVPASISFNSGSSSEVALYITNVDVECRFDSFTITVD